MWLQVFFSLEIRHLELQIMLTRPARRMASSGMLRRVALVKTDVSEELSASIIRVTRIGELETTLAVTSNRRMLRRNTKRVASEKASTGPARCMLRPLAY
jgi:hypothetical protein